MNYVFHIGKWEYDRANETPRKSRDAESRSKLKIFFMESSERRSHLNAHVELPVLNLKCHFENGPMALSSIRMTIQRRSLTVLAVVPGATATFS